MRHSTSNFENPGTCEKPAGAGIRAARPIPVIAKRLYDLILSGFGLVLLSPLFLVIAGMIRVANGRPIFYCQTRVGLNGRPFQICKFRTMIPNADHAGPSLTQGDDRRVTGVGKILRRTKLDELPQLWNVLMGEMSLVGPRPEVPHYVRHYTPEQREILRHKPGITDLATLCFRDEETLFRNAANLEEFYVRHCIPRKSRLNREYAERANLLSDTWIIIQTVCPYWIGVLAAYGIILLAACWLSYGLVYDFALPASPIGRRWKEMGLVLAIQLACLGWRKQCRGLLSYFSFPEARQTATALAIAAAGVMTVHAVWDLGPPRNVVLVNALVSASFLGVFRILLRLWRERTSEEAGAATGPPARIGIIGAGSTGAKLALELIGRRNLGRVAVAFFDDDFQKWRKCIHEIPVVGMPECLVEGWADQLDEVVIAMPSAPAERIREITQLLGRTRLKSAVMPSAPMPWSETAATRRLGEPL